MSAATPAPAAADEAAKPAAPWWRPTRRRLIWLAALLVAHELMLAWMLSSHAAAILLSAGAQTPLLPAMIALGFIAVRVTAVLGLPGLLLYTVVSAWRDHRASSAAAQVSAPATQT